MIGEPFQADRRLIAVRLITRFTVVAALMTALAAPAAAQSSGVDLEATVGLGGWVAGDRPMLVAATVDAEVLFVGEIEVVYGGASTLVPVEVPAGGSKVYEVVARPPLGQSNLTVRLLDDEGKRVEQVNVRPRVAGGEVVVAVDRDQAIADRLATARTVIDNVPIEPVTVDGTDIDLSPVAYLVTGATSVDPGVWEWVAAGGRLLAPGQLIDTAPVPLTPVGNDQFTFGHGEVAAVDVGTADWSRLIRPAPIELVSTDVWSSAESQLTRAATGASDTGLATLPWLLGAVLAYAVLVGPLNLLVLRRLKRRELAWLTIPAIALLALGVFWLAGRQRLDETTIRHATVAIGSGDTGYALSSVVLAAGTGGTRELTFNDATALYPVSVDAFNEFGADATTSVLIDGNRAEFQLPQLGVAATQVRRPALQAPTVVTAAGDGGILTVTLTNDTGVRIDYWGATLGSTVAVSPRSVEPGQSDSIDLKSGNLGGEMFFDPGMGFGDVVVQERQIWDDERGWQVISPLGGAASAELGFGRSAVFAISEEIDMSVQLDGSDRSIPGPVVYAIPLDAGDGSGTLTRATGDVVATQNVDFIEAYGAGAFIHAEVVTLSFRVPDGIEGPRLEIGEGWARPDRVFEIYDWIGGGFVEVEEGQAFDPVTFVSAGGEVLVHAFRQGENQFEGEPISPGIITLEWNP